MGRKGYIDNNLLKDELIKHVETGVVSDELANMFQLLAKNLLRKGNFSGYTFKDDLYSDAIYDLLKYSHNYNPEKGVSAFGYITTIAYQSMVRRIVKEKKYHERKIRLLQNTSVTDIYETIDNEEYDNEYLENIKQMYETRLPAEKEKTEKPPVVTSLTELMDLE